MRERRKELVGRVVSDRMQKTVVVAVDRLARHRLYQRTMRRTTKFMAHDEADTCRVGDLVRIQESRPISKHKHWRVVTVLEVAAQRGRAVEVHAHVSGAGVPDVVAASTADVPGSEDGGDGNAAGAVR